MPFCAGYQNPTKTSLIPINGFKNISNVTAAWHYAKKGMTLKSFYSCWNDTPSHLRKIVLPLFFLSFKDVPIYREVSSHSISLLPEPSPQSICCKCT